MKPSLKHRDGKPCECVCRPCLNGLHGACLIASLAHVCHCDCNWGTWREMRHEFQQAPLGGCKVCGLNRSDEVHGPAGFGDRMPGGWGPGPFPGTIRPLKSGHVYKGEEDSHRCVYCHQYPNDAMHGVGDASLIVGVMPIKMVIERILADGFLPKVIADVPSGGLSWYSDESIHCEVGKLMDYEDLVSRAKERRPHARLHLGTWPVKVLEKCNSDNCWCWKEGKA
jgi:hypothetical protein